MIFSRRRAFSRTLEEEDSTVCMLEIMAARAKVISERMLKAIFVMLSEDAVLYYLSRSNVTLGTKKLSTC